MKKRPVKKQENTAKHAEAGSGYDKIAWATAIGIHLLMAFVFAFVNVGWRYDIPEWVEMEFVAIKKTQPETRRAKPVSRPVAKRVKKKSTPARKVIKLPKRRMLENDTPKLRARRVTQFADEKKRDAALRRRDVTQKQDYELQNNTRGQNQKNMADLGDIQTGEKDVSTSLPDFGKGVAIPFKIEGEAANRTVSLRKLPEYPSGLSRSALVKLRFVIMPDGVVAKVVPVMKGDATLEKAAIAAFRQWRFNALPRNAVQKEQRGTITFRFVLQ